MRRALVTLSLAGALGLLPACSKPPSPSVALVSQEAVASGHPELVRRWNAALERVRKDGDDAAAWVELARLGLAQGYGESTDAALAECRRLQPTEARWPYFQAVREAGYGRLDGAVADLALARRLDPAAEIVCIKYADTLARLGHRTEAEGVLREWLAGHPRHAHALYLLGRLAFDAGDWAGAQARLQEAREADPSFGAPASLLATVAEKRGDEAAAVELRRQASALGRYREPADPWLEEYWKDCYDAYRLQVAASAVGTTPEPGKADEWLERARQLAPEDPRTYRQLGRLALARRQYPQAIAWFEQAVTSDPGHAPTYLDWIEALKYLRQREQGERVIERGLAACPDSAGLHYEKALLLIAQQRQSEALPYLERTLELEPERYMAYQTLAAQFFRIGKFSEGHAVLQRGLGFHPDQPALLAMLLRYHIEAGHREEAEATWRRSARSEMAPAVLNDLTQMFEKRFRSRPQ